MSFWDGQQVIVTGGAGFVGSHLVELLLDAGAMVHVADDYSRGSNMVAGAVYHECDVSSSEQLQTLCVHTKPTAIFNLAAAVAGVIYNQSNHLEMYDRNMRLQTVPVQVAETLGTKRFLQVSSVCVYAPDYNHPCEEPYGQLDAPTKANEGYSWAKRMGEHVATWSKISHVVTVRPSNVFGPRDYFDEKAHVIPALIKKALSQNVIEVNGTGKEQREFIYVKDIASGMMYALERGANREVYNIGTHGDTCISIGSLMTMIQRETGTLQKPVKFSSTHDAGDLARWSDCSKIHKLGWQHKIGMMEGLRQTVNWYLEQVSADINTDGLKVFS